MHRKPAKPVHCHALAPQAARHPRYWTGPVDRGAGFRTVLIYCVGQAELPNGYLSRTAMTDTASSQASIQNFTILVHGQRRLLFWIEEGSNQDLQIVYQHPKYI